MKNENKEIISIVLLVFLPIILFFASFLMGRYPVSPVDVVKTILSPIFPQLTVSSTINTIVWQIRLPRILAALLVGASLSMAGTAFQGIFKNPLVSIIIPVYNKFDYTYRCISSIIKSESNISYEIIIANDMSKDETKIIDKYIKNIII